MGNSPASAPPAAAPAAAAPSAYDKAVLELKVTRDKLLKQKRKMIKESEQLTANAKEQLRNGHKDRAALLLKTRRFREAEVARVEGQIGNLERLVQNLEKTETDVRVFDSLKTGNQALKELQDLMPLEQVQKLMEDTEDAIRYSDELSELLAASMDPTDEQQAERDLDAMMRELNLSALPEVPTTVPVDKKEPATTVPSKGKVQQLVAG